MRALALITTPSRLSLYLDVAAARPPPGWAVAVLAGDRSARVARRYGNDMGAARAAAQKAVDEAAVVDAATRNALAALV